MKENHYFDGGCSFIKDFTFFEGFKLFEDFKIFDGMFRLGKPAISVSVYHEILLGGIKAWFTARNMC